MARGNNVGWRVQTLTAELAQAQTDALAPIHKAAVANAKRLRKS